MNPPEFWRPVFDLEGHELDVFSRSELFRVGGDGGLLNNLKEAGIHADNIEAPVSIQRFLKPGDTVIRHRPSEAKASHELYESLGLQKEPIIYPQ